MKRRNTVSRAACFIGILTFVWIARLNAADALNRLGRAELDAFFLEQLTFELYRSESNPRLQETISRMTLQVDPVHRPALQILLDRYLRQNEAVMAEVVFEYARTCSVENVLTDHVRMEAALMALQRDSTDEDVLWTSWYELYREDLDKFRGKLSESVYERMESRIRKFVGRSSNSLDDKLDELAVLMELKGEQTMVAMLANYLNVKNPGDLHRLETAVLNLQTVEQHESVKRKLKGYLDREVVSGEIAEFLSRSCYDQGLHEEAVAFSRRWSKLRPRDPDARLVEAMGWLKLNKYDEARGVLLAAAGMEGHATDCYRLLAFIYAEFGEEEHTVIWLERLVPSLSDEEVIDLISREPFSRMPTLLTKLDKR